MSAGIGSTAVLGPRPGRSRAAAPRARVATRVLQRTNGLLHRLAGPVVLFRAGELVFVRFGLFAALGAFVGTSGMALLLVAQGLAPGSFAALALAGGAAVVAGSWLLGQLLDWRLLLRRPAQALRRPVFVSWGGFFALLAVIAAFGDLNGLRALLVIDALARFGSLGHALGRIGCLSYGCCHGRPTAGPLAITYRDPDSKAVRVAGLRGVPVHPAPVYEVILDLGIFAAVNAAALLGAPVGVPAALLGLLYAVGRFGIEFLRDNRGRMLAGGLSLNHVICLALGVASGALLYAATSSALSAPATAWPLAWAAGPSLLPISLWTAALVFLGFSMHRGRVGAW